MTLQIYDTFGLRIKNKFMYFVRKSVEIATNLIMRRYLLSSQQYYRVSYMMVFSTILQMLSYYSKNETPVIRLF